MASKMLPAADKPALINLGKADLSIPNLTKLFGWTAKKVDGKFTRIPPKYNTMDRVHLDAGEYINIEEVDTTVGSILWNKLFVEGTVETVIPNHFFNEEVTEKAFDKVMDWIAEGLKNGVLTVKENLLPFLKNYEFYSMKLVTIFSPSYTKGLFQTNANIKKKKEEVLKNRKSDSLYDIVKMEDELVAFAKNELKNDPGMTLFDSGARGSFDNDYKNMNLMVGAVKNASDGSYDVIKHGYLDGLKKEDLVAAGNLMVNSIYPKACGTAISGYLTKQFYAVYQSIMTDPSLEDCGTKHCLEFVLEKQYANDLMYQFIQKTNGVEMLTPENVDKYIGKKIKLRSPMFCGSDKICYHCMGDMPKTLGITAVGLTTGRIPNTILAKKMKLFHVGKVKFDDVNVDDLLM